MNTPQSDGQQVPENQELKKSPQYFVPLGIVGIVMVILLIAGLPMTVMFEQRHRTEEQTISLALPSPIPQQSQTPSPTPRTTYQPQIAGMSKEKALELFQAVTFERDIYRANKHLVRWDQEKIPWRLRGQFTSEDRQCLTSITQQFNSALKTAQLEEMTDSPSSRNRTAIEIYVLPGNQFSSVNPDIRPDEPAQLFYSRSGYSLSSVDVLIDLNQAIGFRCYYLHDLMLQAVGIAFSITDASLTGPIASPNFIDNARYSASDLEMLRILYSPLLTAGLTQTEVERRLMQE